MEEYARPVSDSNDKIPEGGKEKCLTARLNSHQNYVLGLARVHETTQGSVTTYERALEKESGPADECFIYWTLTNDKDEQYTQGPTSFGEKKTKKGNYCGAEASGAVVVSFAVTGATVVIEFEGNGELGGQPVDVAELRDSILPQIFEAVAN